MSYVVVDRSPSTESSDLEGEESQDVDLLPEHVYRTIGQPDILEAIMDVCQQEKSYGTIALLASISKHHQSIVQPRLTRLKKRIVLNLDEFYFRNKDNDENIEIIQCTRISPLPVSTRARDPNKVQNRLDAIHQELQPTTIIFRGRLHESALQIWRYVFPSATLLVCIEDAYREIVEGANDLPGNWKSNWHYWAKPNQAFMCAFLDNHGPLLSTLEHAIKLRYRHFPLLETKLTWCQRHSFRGVMSEGQIELEQEVLWDNGQYPQKQIIPECMNMIPRAAQQFEHLSLYCYFRLSEIRSGAFFYQSDDGIPSGYTTLSREIEDAVKKLLKDGRARFVFRLFITGHGDEEQDRADMVPIYSTTCAVQGTDPATRTVMVFQRTIDEDFVKCPMNHGCKRCRRSESG